MLLQGKPQSWDSTWGGIGSSLDSSLILCSHPVWAGVTHSLPAPALFESYQTIAMPSIVGIWLKFVLSVARSGNTRLTLASVGPFVLWGSSYGPHLRT